MAEGDEIVYTEEERAAMREALETFSGYKVHPANAERLHRIICSRALYQYAVDQIEDVADRQADEDNNDVRQGAQKKAQGALLRAYDTYPFPLYLHDLAGLCQIDGDDSRAFELYCRFLQEYRSFRPHALDQGLFRERDVAAAAKDAVERATALAEELGVPFEPPRKSWWKVWQ